MHVHVCKCTCVHMHVEDRGQPQLEFLRNECCPPCLMGQGFSPVWNFPSRLDWVANVPQGSSCLHLSIFGITKVHATTPGFSCGCRGANPGLHTFAANTKLIILPPWPVMPGLLHSPCWPQTHDSLTQPH